MTTPQTPPGWFPDPAGTPQQRYFDGREWTAHYAPYDHSSRPLVPPITGPPKKSNAGRILLGLGAGIVILFVIGLAAGGKDDDTNDNTAASSSTSTSRLAVISPPPLAPQSSLALPPEPPTQATPAGMNEEVRDGKFGFVITSVDSSTVAGDPSNQFMREEAQGVFVNVHMTVTNIGDQPQTFFADNQKLIIDGREYSAHTMAAVWTGVSNVEVNPGNSIAAVVSFDVPNPPGGPKINAVELHDSAFSGGVTVYPR